MRAATFTPSPKMCPLSVHDDLAEMHADTQHQSLLLVQHRVEARHALLDIDRRRDRGEGRVEFGQQGIACVVDQRAADDFDGWPPKLGLRRFEMPDSEVLVALHHANETGDVGMEYRGKTALRACHYAGRITRPVARRPCRGRFRGCGLHLKLAQHCRLTFTHRAASLCERLHTGHGVDDSKVAHFAGAHDMMPE
jgi:hypothetical protein